MRLLLLLFAVLTADAAIAGGGLVLQDDTCIITVGFYEAHFTAYQPQASGDRQFCDRLPDTGPTIFVLDYLHDSLKSVPVDLRLLENVTGKGEFARLADVEAMDDVDGHTVFYQPPVIRANGTFVVEHDFAARGDYLGIITAGHPTNDKTYTAVFTFSVGRAAVPWPWLAFGAVLLAACGLVLGMKRVGRAPATGSA